MAQSATANSVSSIHFRLAEEADQARLIVLVNSAFSVETFLEGTRTDSKRLAEDMRKGRVVVAEDGGGRLLGCVYAEVRGARGYLGMGLNRMRKNHRFWTKSMVRGRPGLKPALILLALCGG
jgi:hypothetical protein